MVQDIQNPRLFAFFWGPLRSLASLPLDRPKVERIVGETLTRQPWRRASLTPGNTVHTKSSPLSQRPPCASQALDPPGHPILDLAGLGRAKPPAARCVAFCGGEYGVCEKGPFFSETKLHDEVRPRQTGLVSRTREEFGDVRMWQW